jgi:large subunit ribosomal protein L10
MERNAKRELVDNLKKELQEVESIFLCNFKGLSVEKDTQLRAKMRESGSNYSVVKNTLLKIAFAERDFSKVSDKLVGNTALAYNREDTVALAKLIRDFAKENATFEFKAGVVEGQVIDVSELETLASLPSKEVLVSKLMYMLNFPVQGLVTSLSGIMRNLAVVLDQIKQQKENS